MAIYQTEEKLQQFIISPNLQFEKNRKDFYFHAACQFSLRTFQSILKSKCTYSSNFVHSTFSQMAA